MTIRELKKDIYKRTGKRFENKDIAKLFSMSEKSFDNSTAKKRYENALCCFYEQYIR